MLNSATVGTIWPLRPCIDIGWRNVFDADPVYGDALGVGKAVYVVNNGGVMGGGHGKAVDFYVGGFNTGRELP